MQIDLTCQRCGKSFPVKPYRAKVARYCSYECSYGPPPVELICETCDKAFMRKPSEAASSRFCSRACASVGQRMGVAERLWPKVNKNGPLPERHPEFGVCWLRSGATTGGYSSFTINRREVTAHVAAYGLVAEIPPGMSICHTCDVRTCVRNDTMGVYVVDGVEYPRRGHLFCAPPSVNQQDMIAKGRQARGDRHMSRTKPEALRRGDNHPARMHPELLKRGDDNYVRQHPEIVQGERNGNAKLTNDQVREIRRRHAEGRVTLVALSADFSVSAVLIGLIVRGKAWRHVV